MIRNLRTGVIALALAATPALMPAVASAHNEPAIPTSGPSVADGSSSTPAYAGGRPSGTAPQGAASPFPRGGSPSPLPSRPQPGAAPRRAAAPGRAAPPGRAAAPSRATATERAGAGRAGECRSVSTSSHDGGGLGWYWAVLGALLVAVGAGGAFGLARRRAPRRQLDASPLHPSLPPDAFEAELQEMLVEHRAAQLRRERCDPAELR